MQPKKEVNFLPYKLKSFFPDSEFIFDDGTLILPEKYLDRLPLDWFDCISFIVSWNFGKNNDFLVILDDEETEILIRFSSKKQLSILVWEFVKDSENKPQKFWNLLLREYKGKRILVGGENLRKFCDKRNIYYASIIGSNGELYGTDMQYEKIKDEDVECP